jgi:hypothetical protein
MPRITATVLALVALAGCSGGEDDRLSKPEYEEKVQTVYAEVQLAFQSTRGAEGEELAGRIVLAQESLRHAADELAAVSPPEEVEVHHADLIEGMREYADALDEAVRAASRNDVDTLQRFQNVANNPGVREMAEAAEEMKLKGYDLGPIADE